MKKIYYLFVLIAFVSYGQVQVTTLTPQIKGSGGLSLDDSGNLIIADYGDFLSVPDNDGIPNKVYIMDSNFNITDFATGFVGASGNDFDSNGVLYQSDIRDQAIYKIVGGVRTFVTSTGISAPVGIVFDSNDDFFVCNCGNNTIQKVTSSGVSTTFASGTIFQCPNGITIDEDDNLYVSNFSDGSIIKITPAGVTTLLTTTPGGTTSGPSNGHLDYHQPTRTLFIASHGSNRIFALRLDDTSNLIDIAGSGARGNDDGTGETASFSRPNGVAVTPDGDSIYVNSAVPVTNVPNGPLNPQLIRLITNVQSILSSSNINKDELGIHIYPVPATDLVNIEIDTNDGFSELELNVYDVQGKLANQYRLQNLTLNGFKGSLDISKLNSGLYIIEGVDQGKKVFEAKIVKE